MVEGKLTWDSAREKVKDLVCHTKPELAKLCIVADDCMFSASHYRAWSKGRLLVYVIEHYYEWAED